MNINKLNSFLSTLNFVLLFTGYQFVTTIFLPASSDLEGISRSVTVPYRALALLLMLAVIALNILKTTKKIYPYYLLFVAYWALLVCRMIFDVYFRNDVFLSNTSQLWLYVFGICIPGFISVKKSFDVIDKEKALKWILISLAIILVSTLLQNESLMLETSDAVTRVDANVALNTISFGHLGVTALLLSFFYLSNRHTSLVQKLLLFVLISVSIFCMLRAGSRGPILALFSVFTFWLFARGKNIFLKVFLSLVFLGLVILFIRPILELIGLVSPVLQERLFVTIFVGDDGEREILRNTALEAFAESPVLGKQFALFQPDGTFAYSHNILIDALMGLGLLGGIMMLVILVKALIVCLQNIKNKQLDFWISLILLQQILLHMLSAAFYQDPLLSGLLAFHLVYRSAREKLKSNSLAI